MFALETPGTYSVQMRDDVGEFLILDTLELTGNDAFTVQFDTARIISFLPIEGEIPVIHAVVGPNSKKLTVSKAGLFPVMQKIIGLVLNAKCSSSSLLLPIVWMFLELIMPIALHS